MPDFSSYQEELEHLKKEGRYRPLTIWDSASDKWMEFQGRRILQMSSNNYLGFTGHPVLKKACMEFLEQYGVGSGSVRTITGTLRIHDQLEQELAAFKGTEAALVFQSGFTANQGVLSSILSDRDIVISDELNHASIIDGIRLTKAARKIYGHKDMNQLEEVLKNSTSYRHKVIVTDGVFSMDGDIAPLPDIVQLAERYDAFVYVDDAHASGVLGKYGKGSIDHFGLHGRVHFQIGTLSKAVGTVGGYVACEQIMKECLIHKARSFLFSTSLPPAIAAASLAAIRQLQQSEELMKTLWQNDSYFREGCRKLGLDTGASETPIIPVIIGSPEQVMKFSDRLLQEGIFAQGIVYPTVAMDKGRVRFIVTAQHTRKELDFVLGNLASIGREFGLI
ncbi:glycine C-acetyltransferase [Paenibacillus larvae]